MTGAVWVMYAPYLPLLKRHEIDGWMLVPAPELGEGEVANELATRIAPGLARLYAIENEGMRLGAFVFRAGVGVGGEIDGADVRLMHRALAIAVLDGNPDPPKLGEVGASIEAHSAMTSDNALVYGHRIGAEGWVAAEYGAMIRTRSGGYNVFDDDSMRFRPPTDLHVPSWPRNLDGELATAVHRCIAVDSDEARRLDRTIGWLDLAWRNAEAITLDLRVMAVRSGFEVLFDVDPALEATAEIRSGLSRLLDEPQAPRTAHRWPNLKGKLRDPEDLSELEWWWMRFTFLRNAIAHGGVLTDELYEHDGYSHLDLGVHRLKQAIKATVIAQGYPELGLTPSTTFGPRSASAPSTTTASRTARSMCARTPTATPTICTRQSSTRRTSPLMTRSSARCRARWRRSRRGSAGARRRAPPANRTRPRTSRGW
jgi:hypothetical protein